MKKYQKEVLEAALAYIERGWKIFPLHTIDEKGVCTCGNNPCSDAGKHPRVQRGVKEASSDRDQILQWFGPGSPPSNIGLATGAVSGITVLDIDIGEGKFGAESWAEAIKDHGEPDTLMAETGSGGMHVVFAYNSALKTATNVLGKGVDSRNDGGYIVAAPGRHRTGGVYKWLNWGTDIAPLPAHLSRRKETRGRPKKDDMYRGKYSIEQVKGMLEFVPADDRDLWRSVGIILGREFDRSDEAWGLYTDWSGKWTGKKGRNHDEVMHEAFYEISQQDTDKQLSLGTIVKSALDNGWAPKIGEVPIGNFVFYAPGNNYIYRPTGSFWIAAAVDSAVSPVNENGKLQKASDWLRFNVLATSMTSDPSTEDDYIKGLDCRDGEIVKSAGGATFNTYRRPTIELGVAKMAEPFIEHVKRVFNKPGDADQFLDYMAHRVQRPWEKPRFALLIAGGQGVGKDTALEFCSPAIGAWNVANIEPRAFDETFNEYASATLVRINEAANLHEMSKWAFNERTKVLIAGSPDYCRINPKYGQKYAVKMYCGVIITTNHLANGIYIPEDDRRYDVIDCATMDEMGLKDEKVRRVYFSDLWEWFYKGGDAHVAACLHDRDISKFNASNGQRKTAAHKTLVASGMSGDEWLDDILEGLGYPTALRIDLVVTKAVATGENEKDVRRKLSNALSRAGYGLHNSGRPDGRWKIGGKLVSVYAKIGTDQNYDPTNDLKHEVF